MNGVENPPVLPHPSLWKLHLKDVTMVDLQAVLGLPTHRSETKPFLSAALTFLDDRSFVSMRTSRTIKSTQLSMEDINMAVSMGKFEKVPNNAFHGNILPEGYNGVNVFAVPELKGRRRLITEPHVNASVDAALIPSVNYPTRLGRRQSLRYAKYMIQIDFEAFYDTIPLPVEARKHFVFRKGSEYFQLRTLPTGARWSVAVGQAITWTIVDIDTPVIIHTMIDNIMIAAHEGEEMAFLKAVRTVVHRIELANLKTSPPRDVLNSASDAELLDLARENNTFLGEEYRWDGSERRIRNSVKTIAKLGLALQARAFSHRSFVSLVSLMLYAIHTTQLNPAGAFQLLRAYRAVYRLVTQGRSWDSLLTYLDPKVYDRMQELGQQLLVNSWWTISEPSKVTYVDEDYDCIVYTDASFAGWGAIAHKKGEDGCVTYQQRWERGRGFPAIPPTHSQHLFHAQHSAHAEPKAAQMSLRQLIMDGLPDDSNVALVTDHLPIVHAQRRSNGFGGIGRGYSLNRLFEFVYDLGHTRGIKVNFFHISGPCNPADTLSRVFGVEANNRTVSKGSAPSTLLPSLQCTYSPVCEGLSFKSQRAIY